MTPWTPAITSSTVRQVVSGMTLYPQCPSLIQRVENAPSAIVRTPKNSHSIQKNRNGLNGNASADTNSSSTTQSHIRSEMSTVNLPGEALKFVPQEKDSDECPYCHAQFTEFLRYEGTADNGVKVSKCHSCNTIFKIKSQIPY